MITLGIDTSKLQKQCAQARARFLTESMAIARDLGSGTQEQLRDYTPGDTGGIRESWKLSIEPFRGGKAGARFDIESDGDQHTQDVIWWLEKGTGIYGPEHRMIRPKRAKVLHWHENPRMREHSHEGELSALHDASARYAKEVKGIQPFAMVAKAEAWLENQTWRAAVRFTKIFGDIFR